MAPKKEKIEYPECPPLNWTNVQPTNSVPLDGEVLYLVANQSLREAPSIRQRGQLVFCNTCPVAVGYTVASPGFVFTENQMVLCSENEDVLKERRAEAKARISQLLESRAIVKIGTVEAWGIHWQAHLSDEGRRIIEDTEAWLLAQVRYPENRRLGDEIDAAGEDLFFLIEGRMLSVYGRRDSPLAYPALVVESILDEGYRPDRARRAETIARHIAEGTIIRAGKIFPTTEETPNILTGRPARFRLELDKQVRAELEQAGEADYWRRQAEYIARTRPGYEPTVF